jgi:ATP phosphoribosyltransferase regulatory subunit
MITSTSALRQSESARQGPNGRSDSEPSDAADAPAAGWLTPPVGTRDVLPPEASERRALSRTLLSVYAEHGYSLVTTPPFERIDVLERLGTLRASEVLQFVDGDTGEVAVFRPDITPQIARLVATRLRDRPPPYRLAYEGHVLRRRLGRARRQRQIAQCGLECIGLPGAEGEAEIIEVAIAALARVGLAQFSVELALVPLVRMLLEQVPMAQRSDAAEALARKDGPALSRATRATDARFRAILEAVIDLHGDLSVLAAARRVLKGHGELLSELTQLEALAKTLTARGLGDRLVVDLGEVRGFGYYTGPSFALLAEGPGEPIGSGGRYDDLLGRFGHPAAGAGFALDMDHLAWALRSAGTRTKRAPEIDCAIVAPKKSGPEARALASQLRSKSIRVADLSARSLHEGRAWCLAWSVPALIELTARGIVLYGADGASTSIRDAAELARHLAPPRRDEAIPRAPSAPTKSARTKRSR